MRTTKVMGTSASPSKRRSAADLRRVVLASGAALAAALVALASAAHADDAGAKSDAGAKGDAGAVPACIKVTATTRYVPYGWSHIVGLANGCTRDASCTVSTDVNPEKQTAQVPKGGSVEVVTFLSSPSQTFTPVVACTLR